MEKLLRKIGKQSGPAATVNMIAAEINEAISCQPEKGIKKSIPNIKLIQMATHGIAKRFVLETIAGASPCNPIE